MTEAADDLRVRPQSADGSKSRHPQGVPVHDVFVSYSTRDKPVADALVSRLEQAGVRCWVAPRDILPGMVWGEAIIHAIATTRLMVVILSGEANASRHVLREVERAVASDVVVVPFRIDGVEPTGAMAYFLASEHWLDAMTPPLDAHIARLVEVCQALLGTSLDASASSAPPVETAAAPATDVTARPRRVRRRLVVALSAAGVVLLAALGVSLWPSLFGGDQTVTDQAGLPEGFLLHTDEAEGFSIGYPEGWVAFPNTPEGLREGEEALGWAGLDLSWIDLDPDWGRFVMVDVSPLSVDSDWVTTGVVMPLPYLAADPETAEDDVRDSWGEIATGFESEPIDMRPGAGTKVSYMVPLEPGDESVTDIEYRVRGSASQTWVVHFTLSTDRVDHYNDITDAIAGTFELTD